MSKRSRAYSLNSGLLQVSAARVKCNIRKVALINSYEDSSTPSHEKMIHLFIGGIAIIPDLTDIHIQQKAHYHPVTPVFLRSGVIFNFPFFTSRTPFSPAQCMISTEKAGGQRSEGFIIALAILPKEATRFVPIGDARLAVRMTEVVNERLARNGKGITCHIDPLETYGDLMEIGQQTR